MRNLFCKKNKLSKHIVESANPDNVEQVVTTKAEPSQSSLNVVDEKIFRQSSDIIHHLFVICSLLS